METRDVRALEHELGHGRSGVGNRTRRTRFELEREMCGPSYWAVAGALCNSGMRCSY
jgi:hypothetical protein